MIPDTYTEIRGEPFIIDMMYAGLNNNMTGRAVYAEIGLGNGRLFTVTCGTFCKKPYQPWNGSTLK